MLFRSTVAELGEMLPPGTIQKRKGNDLHKEAVDMGIELNICPKWGKDDMRYCLYLAGNMEYVKDDNEANARAKMLIYLFENRLLSL